MQKVSLVAINIQIIIIPCNILASLTRCFWVFILQFASLLLTGGTKQQLNAALSIYYSHVHKGFMKCQYQCAAAN